MNANASIKSRPRGASPRDIAWRGIELCREGEWKEGLYWLGLAAEANNGAAEMPSLFFAYLGYGVARYQGRLRQGVKLCSHALELEFYQPETYDFLARTHLLAGDRRAAVEVLERGLQIDATDPALLALRAELGTRGRPVIRFLSRGNVINQVLGRVRHRLRGRGRSAADSADSQ